MTDLQLWNAFKKGDKEALGNLFKQYYPLLFQYGNKLCEKKPLLEDCIQELFIEIWQSKTDNEIQSVKAYLLKSLRYKIIKALKGKTFMETTDKLSEELNFEISHENFMIAEQDNADRTRKVLEAVNSLPIRQKEIVYLKIYQNMEYEDVCDVMGINYQVARNLFYEAIKSLRRLIPVFVVVAPEIITKF